MLLLATFILALMAAVNYQIGTKRILYPPVVFCLVWAIDLSLIAASGDFFYPVSPKTLSILASGCLCFSVGSYIALALNVRKRDERFDPPASNKIANWLVVLMLCSVPLVYRWVSSIAQAFSGPNFFMSAYMAVNAAYEEGDQSIVMGNLITFAPTIGLICFYERDKHKKRALFALILALGITAMTGGRAAMVTIVLGVIALDWIRTYKFNLKLIVPAMGILFIGVCALAILVHKGDATEEAPISENVKPVLQGLITYAAGGIPAFSQVVEQPSIIPHNWQIYYPAARFLNHFGARFDVPSAHAEFVTIGPENLQTNIYTLYFAYIDFGWAIAMLFLGLIGFIVARVYMCALAGGNIAAILYSYLFASMILSPFADFFFMGVNYIFKLLIIAWIVYALPRRWAQFKDLCVNSIQKGLREKSNERGVA